VWRLAVLCVLIECAWFLLTRRATMQGGALYASSDSDSVNFANVSVIGNTAVDGAGVYLLKGTVLRASGSRWASNIAAGSGGGMGVTDTGTLVCEGCTFTGNLAAVDGGALSISGVEFLGIGANVTLHRSSLAGNIAEGSGGAMAVDGASTLSVLWCTVTGNQATQSGGGLYQMGQTASLRVGQTGFGSNGAYYGGAISVDAITATQLLGGITISDGGALVGAGVWWRYLGSANAMMSLRHGGPCVTCTYARNTGTNVATQQWNATLTSTPVPSYRFQAGVPVEAGAPGFVVTTVDVYGQQSMGDYTSSCSIASLNPAFSVVGAAAVPAVGGIVAFRALSVLGPVGTPFNVQVTCNVEDGASVTRGNFIVGVAPVTLGVCHPGSALNVAQYCALCLAGTYSITGTSCAPCPIGASCPQAGVIYPVSDAGYYISRVSDATLTNICGDFAYDSGSCAPGLYVSQRGTSQQTCQPDASLYTANQVYSCTSKFQLYSCQTPVACNAGITQLNVSGTQTSNVGCATGYDGVLCALCIEGYTKNSDRTCR
jgi:hypothetical protein